MPIPKLPPQRELLHTFEFEVGNRARSHSWARFSVWAPTPDAAVERVRELELWTPHDFSETESGTNRRMVDYVFIALDPRRLTVDHITGIDDGAGFGMLPIQRGELRPGLTRAQFNEFLFPRRCEVGVANGIRLCAEEIPAYVEGLEKQAADYYAKHASKEPATESAKQAAKGRLV